MMTVEKKRKTARIGGLFIAGISAVLVGIVIWGQLRQLQAQRTFLPTTGTILESRLKTHMGGRTISTHPHIRFRYQVNGQVYESTTLGFSGKTFWGSDDMSAYIGKYPAGVQVEVYYDPADPAVAILDRTVDSLTYPLLVGAGFILAGIVIAVYGFRGGNSSSPHREDMLSIPN